MNLRGLGSRQARRVKRMINHGLLNSQKITLRWRETSEVPAEYDRNLEGSGAGAVGVDLTLEVKAFIHEVGIGTTGQQRFAEVELGDRILDFPGDVDLDGKADLRFEFDGRVYAQKEAGRELAKSWDSTVNGVRILRTVLVAPVGGAG